MCLFAFVFVLQDTLRRGCECEYTCTENALTYPFVCTHFPALSRELCEDYELRNNIKPASKVNYPPVCFVNGTANYSK